MRAGEDFPLKDSQAGRTRGRRKEWQSLTWRLESLGRREGGEKEGARKGEAEGHGWERKKKRRQREKEGQREVESAKVEVKGIDPQTETGRRVRAEEERQRESAGDIGLDPEARIQKRKMSEQSGGGGQGGRRHPKQGEGKGCSAVRHPALQPHLCPVHPPARGPATAHELSKKLDSWARSPVRSPRPPA